jgi:acetyl esterase/lipase
VWNVSRPTLTAYFPDPSVATGTAAIVCPGGSFHFLAIEHEGTEVARWLVARGVAAFVLRYRVLPTPDTAEGVARHTTEVLADSARLQAEVRRLYPLLAADGLRAVGLVRQRGSDWSVRPERVGIIGFSAGGTLAVATALRDDPQRRPAFVAAIYPAPGGPAHVPAEAPPLFLALASDDDLAAGASVPLYSAWRVAGRPAELHIFSKGGHGFGLRQQGLPSDRWADQLYEWLKEIGVLERAL